MKNFFEKNKILLAILVGVLIIAAAIYFSRNKTAKEAKTPEIISTKKCENIPGLEDNSSKLATKIISVFYSSDF